MIFAHGTELHADPTLAQKVSDALQTWYVAVPLITILTIGSVIGAVYLLTRYSSWQYPSKRKD
jgi:hypothetical protein